jgi:hypothetical protein
MEFPQKDRAEKKFLTLETENGGGDWSHWEALHADAIDPGQQGGAAFAASNSSVFIPPQINPAPALAEPGASRRAWVGIGGKGGARVFLGFNTLPNIALGGPDSAGFGWSSAVAVPLAGLTDSTGVFSISFRRDFEEEPLNGFRRDPYQRGVVVGGDYTKPNKTSGTSAWSSDGGEHWIASTTPPRGYRSTVQWFDSLKVWITAGTNGSDFSRDDGKTWQPLDDGNWNALSLPFVVGPKGRIARLNAAAMPKP